MHRFTITCDDCGISEGINSATARLHEQGLATAASIMTNMPAADHAFDLFAAYPDLELGVHLNISDGYPLTDIPAPSALTRSSGRFHHRLWAMIRTLLPTPHFMTLFEAELRGQIEVFSARGLTPGHITTHRHFHISPLLRPVVIKLAEAYGIPWLRAYRLSASIVPVNPFHSTGREDQQYSPIFVPDHLINIKSWMRRDPAQLVAVLRDLEGVAEFIVHPCTLDDPTFPPEVYYKPHQRHAEMQYFTRAFALLRDSLTEKADIA